MSLNEAKFPKRSPENFDFGHFDQACMRPSIVTVHQKFRHLTDLDSSSSLFLIVSAASKGRTRLQSEKKGKLSRLTEKQKKNLQKKILTTDNF